MKSSNYKPSNIDCYNCGNMQIIPNRENICRCGNTRLYDYSSDWFSENYALEVKVVSSTKIFYFYNTLDFKKIEISYRGNVIHEATLDVRKFSEEDFLTLSNDVSRHLTLR